MTIEKNVNGNDVTVKVIGRLDTTTAPDLEAALKELLPDAKKLTFDFSELEYLSSAGLRVLLGSQKIMAKQGEMKVLNINQTISDIFHCTGFDQILNIG